MAKRKWVPWARDEKHGSEGASARQARGDGLEAKGDRRVRRGVAARTSGQRRAVPAEAEREPTREDTRNLLAQAGVDESPSADEGTLPDVLLDVPTVKVDEITLEVNDLHARVALHAQLANLVNLDVGAQVDLGRVVLTIKGVEAQALLKVRLRNVYAILDRALQTIDAHPEILQSLLTPIGEAVGNLGVAAREALEPEGAVSSLVKDVGGTAREALAPEGALTRTLGDVGSVARNLGGPGGVADRLVSPADPAGAQRRAVPDAATAKGQRRASGRTAAKRTTPARRKPRASTGSSATGSSGRARAQAKGKK